jgi:hypothetical protein
VNPEKILRRLGHAVEEQHPVRIRRAGLDDAPLYGFVVQVTDRWVVLQSLENAVYIEGLRLVRLRDITAVHPDQGRAYIERAVTALGRPDPDLMLADGARTPDVLGSAAAQAPLIGVHCEYRPDQPLLVGRLGDLGAKRFELHFIDAHGIWAEEPDRWRYPDVSMVELGSRYLTALERFGDVAPD